MFICTSSYKQIHRYKYEKIQIPTYKRTNTQNQIANIQMNTYKQTYNQIQIANIQINTYKQINNEKHTR